MLAGKHILLGVCGGIAVYRAAELARMLIKHGARVRCVMTSAACAFVTPLTFEGLTGEPVYTRLFDLTAEREMGHIRLARWADLILIAPATANLISKFALGIADDLLSTLLQAADAPVLLAPAMNASMWKSDAIRANVAALKSRGHHFIGPESGELACGEHGEGRLAELQEIIASAARICSTPSLEGRHWVINAGPTYEAWDSVRILTNRASGRLGAHLADLAAMKSASVDLIAGPGTPSCHQPVRRIDVESAEEMLAACEQRAAGADVFIATAAVSDYRFADPHAGKLKRSQAVSLNVELKRNPDIVARIAAMKNRPRMVIGFAAETDHHIEHARDKLRRKGLDAVIANDASAMGKREDHGWWIDADGVIDLPGGDKRRFAEQIIHCIMEKQR